MLSKVGFLGQANVFRIHAYVESMVGSGKPVPLKLYSRSWITEQCVTPTVCAPV
jgi:hypothetical protein